MRAMLDYRRPTQVIACVAAFQFLGFIAGVARGQDWWANSSQPRLLPVPVTTDETSGEIAQSEFLPAAVTTGVNSAPAEAFPLADAIQKGTKCEADCCWNCNLCPCHYAVVEALILERNIQGTPLPLAVDTVTGDTLLTTDDLDFPFSGGLRAYIGHRFCCCWAWELGYTGLFGANASTTAEGDFALPNDFGLNTNVFFGADRLALDYTTDIHSPEFNLVCCCCRCCEPSCGDPCGQQLCCSTEWIYGLRYFRIDDDLEIAAERDEVGGTETGSYLVEASNDLYGGQFGIRLRRCRGPWSLEGTGKVGLYYNDAHQTQTITDFPDFILRQSGASEDHVATVWELNATLIRQITDHWYVRGGYNLIWLDGIALAPSQLDFTQTSTSGTDIDAGDTLFLHGFNFGFEGRW